MKYFVILTFALLSVFSVLAQDKNADDLMKEGDIAVAAKDYSKGLSLYEQAIAKGGLGESEGKTFYNAATCARKKKDINKALKYYIKANKLSYNADMSSYYIAYCYKELDQGSKVEETLVPAIQKHSKSKYVNHMKKMLVNYYLVEGAVPYNDGNNILGSKVPQTQEEKDELIANANVKFEEAKVWFEKAAKYAPTNEKVTTTLAEINKHLSGEVQ
ncbi:MAG: tetratricopeptide repeat protein [Marinilabiliaceae bacterium]|nr:tetratricopeptide repeat protein [Marinilabiliaceae bacterium]